jgi:Cu(I)/Ag(I) efflux system membrane fusion protein/cobalt-zinc-cadmium efflux system membrane fusion protein
MAALAALGASDGATQPRQPAAIATLPKLAPVEISTERRQLIGLKFATIEQRELRGRIETSGVVEVNEQRRSYVQLRTPGWVKHVYADQTWQFVRKGEPLLSVYVPEAVSAEREYLLALRHEKGLGQSTVEGVAEGAKSLVNASEERLRLFGVPEREIERLRRGGDVRQEVEVVAPLGGVVLEREAQPNLYATPETRLYTIADLSEVWIYAAVFQNQLAEVKVGDSVEVTVDSYPGRVFAGRVDFIASVLDSSTRTARVRINLPNRDNSLKLGMFARVALKPRLGSGLVIPESGVLQTGLRNVVFVDRGDGYLEPVEVELGPRVEGGYVARSGLRAGQRIVASANFLIDSESQLQAALGGFLPPPPGAGGPAVVGETATITLRTEPDPPERGRNRVVVTLRDSFGRPVDGAEVSIGLFMPAMPAMGMAEMRASAKALERGAGVYEADVTLQSGGTWQVTVVADKSGRRIATTRISIAARGAM